MVTAAQKASSAEADKPKRKVLSPQEKIAKIEAELAEAKAKASAKDKAELTTLREKRDKLVAKAAEAKAKADTAEEAVDAVESRLAAEGPVTDGVGEAD